MSDTEYDDFDFEKGEPVEVQRWDRIHFLAKLVGPYGPYAINHWARIPAHVSSQNVYLKWGYDGYRFKVSVISRAPVNHDAKSPYIYAGD